MRKNFAKPIIILLFAIGLFGGVFASGNAVAQFANTISGPQTGLKKETLIINTKKGKRTFTVEVAQTAAQQEIGLMWRSELAENQGMIFPFQELRRASFWMKNTIIPLDLIFIRKDGIIDSISQNAKPLDLTPLSSDGYVAAVLELKGGEVKKQGIKVGQKVEYRHFKK